MRTDPRSLEAPNLEKSNAEEAPPTLLDEIQRRPTKAAVALASGRLYELEVGPNDADRLLIRGRGGDVVLRIEVTDAGPVLTFSGATLDLQATQRLRLAAPEVSVDVDGDLSVSVGGSVRETISGDHHTAVGGDERIEAAKVELQANDASIGLRAMGRIALDGEHIGLNDDPLPTPYPWSRIADGPIDENSDPRGGL